MCPKVCCHASQRSLADISCIAKASSCPVARPFLLFFLFGKGSSLKSTHQTNRDGDSFFPVASGQLRRQGDQLQAWAILRPTDPGPGGALFVEPSGGAFRGCQAHVGVLVWWIWRKNRGRFLVYLVVQSTARAIYFPKKDTYASRKLGVAQMNA